MGSKCGKEKTQFDNKNFKKDKIKKERIKFHDILDIASGVYSFCENVHRIYTKTYTILTTIIRAKDTKDKGDIERSENFIREYIILINDFDMNILNSIPNEFKQLTLCMEKYPDFIIALDKIKDLNKINEITEFISWILSNKDDKDSEIYTLSSNFICKTKELEHTVYMIGEIRSFLCDSMLEIIKNNDFKIHY